LTRPGNSPGNWTCRPEFICCNLYDLPQHLDKRYDIVFASYGVVGWLPDLREWGKIIATFLKPGGRFVLVEFHPVVWMFDDDFTGIQYPYFNRNPSRPRKERMPTRPPPFGRSCITWNHGLSEVFNGLLGNGLPISHFEEYDYSPYNCFRIPKRWATASTGSKRWATNCRCSIRWWPKKR
jgi:SAM-dependent methyltransferase